MQILFVVEESVFIEAHLKLIVLGGIVIWNVFVEIVLYLSVCLAVLTSQCHLLLLKTIIKQVYYVFIIATSYCSPNFFYITLLK